MIAIADIIRSMQSIIDDEGSERYLPEQDYFPSIENALREFTSLASAVFAENKGGEELFREITITRVFQTNSTGGVVLSEAQLGHKVWSVAAVYAEPSFYPADATATQIPDDQSVYRPDVTLAQFGDYHVHRHSLEQVAKTRRNRFMDGNERLANGPRRSYAYAWVGNRASGAWDPGDVEFVLLPQSITGRRLIGVSYLRGVDPITAQTTTIPYPDASFGVIRDAALNFIAIKQGARPLYDVSLARVRTLMGVQA